MSKAFRIGVITSCIAATGVITGMMLKNSTGSLWILRDVIDIGGRSSLTGGPYKLAHAVGQAGGTNISRRGPYKLAAGFLPAQLFPPLGIYVSSKEVTTGDNFVMDIVVNSPIEEPFDAYIVGILPTSQILSTVFTGMSAGELQFVFQKGVHRFVNNQPPFFDVPLSFRLLDITITDDVPRGPYIIIAAVIPFDLPIPNSRLQAQNWAISYEEVTVTVY